MFVIREFRIFKLYHFYFIFLKELNSCLIQNLNREETLCNNNSFNLDRNLSASPSSFYDSNCATTSFHIDRVKSEVQEGDNEHMNLFIDEEDKLNFNENTLKDTSTMSTNDTLMAAVSAASTSASCMFYLFFLILI